MSSNSTPTKKKLSSSAKKRKIHPSTPPGLKPSENNDITAETILRSPQKQSSQFFNINAQQTSSNVSSGDSNSLSRGRSLYESSRIKTQEVSPFRKLSPARKSPSPNRRLSLVQLSPKRRNNILHKLNHAMERETQSKKTGGRRLFISHLTLTNFKSYANEQIVGPFNENFTAVVGPNGSGKSNVIDSMLFVFGFRASKLRQGRLSELIHKSENYPNLDYCSVDVHFKYNYRDGFKKSDLEKDELVVTRKAFKNNASKYYINGKESSYTLVTELLKKEGIDLDHKRFLILQGEVESIAQMKPKAEKEGDDGILEYLEDIIGTSKYKPEIESCLVDLETLNETCLDKDNRLKIVQNDLKSLEAGKDESLNYITKERQVVLLTAEKLQLEMESMQAHIETLNSKVGEINREQTSKKDELNSFTEDSKKFKDDFEQNNNRISKLEANIFNMNGKLEDVSQKKIFTEEKIKNHEKTQIKDQESLKAAKANLEKVITEVSKLEEEIEKDSKELNTLKGEKTSLQNDYQIKKQALKDKSVNLEKDITNKEQELAPEQQKISHLESEIILKRQEIQLLQQRKNKNKEKFFFLATKMKEIKDRIESSDKDLKSSKTTYQEKSELKAKCLADLKKKKKELNLLDAECNKNKQKYLEGKSSVNTTETSNKIINALSKLQDQGRISGFYGRLGDLGVIDYKYDVAVSTAAPRLNDIVVQTVECAQKCIDYMRSNRLGYSRFILLDKLPNFENAMNQNFSKILPSNSYRLFDLIKPSKKELLPAFYSILRDTIVAKNLNEAKRIAYSGQRRLRVVTIDGKLIDVSGTMSGGGRQKFKALMKTINSKNENESSLQQLFMTPEELKKLENIYKSSYSDYENSLKEVNMLQEQIDALSIEIPDLETKVSSLEFDLESFENELRNTNQQLKITEEQTLNSENTCEDEISRVQSFIKVNEDEIETIKLNILPKTKEIENLKLAINEIGGFELDQQKDIITKNELRSNKLTARIKKNKLMVKKKSIDKENSHRLIKTLSEKLKNSDKILEASESEVADLNQVMQKLNEEKSKLVEEVSQLKTTNVQLRDKVVYFEEQITNIRNRIFQIKETLKSIINERSHLVEKYNKTKDKIANLKIRDVYEALEVLSCLPVKEAIVENHEAASQPENDDFDKMDVEQDSAETTHEKIPSCVATKEEENDENFMDVEREITNPKTQLVPLSHIEFLNIESYKVDEMDISQYESEIASLQEFLDKSTVNLTALDDYVTNYRNFKVKQKELDDAIEHRDNVKKKCEELKKKRYDEFMKGFNIISQSLKEMYQMITMGGNAELELVDSIDPFSEGILFSVMPPKKSWRNISNLSGGEKTLSSLALVFALHNYKPTPIYIMDEIDAALDFKNVSIVANYIKDRTKDAQFIVISLRNNMFELAERLVGIYKNENMTKSTTIENIDFFN
ncbi:related to Structural maintenance of chromosomes protein 4 [Hanseniaspora guilliermondii]|uniref:Structural maintenance of chromosomes protein n=1 Tax=Hanseniaspora guilliermondii TaxID=56406 RepID=A0A1L0D2G0_9ASCO|nr:related to Structural maintenance of chromosomes protein 4 [Hanseniaspora guilliermondii]